MARKIFLKIRTFIESVRQSETGKKEAAMLPDSRGYFGEYGGRFVPETLVPALDELVAGLSSG